MTDTPTNVSPETMIEAFTEWCRARREIETATAKARNVLKKAKAKGIETDHFPQLKALMSLTETERNAGFVGLFRYLGWLNIPLGVQLDMFEATPSGTALHMLNEMQSEEAGHSAGKRGDKKSSNPHPAGTPHFVAWERGYEAGQAVLAFQLEAKPEPKARRTKKEK